MQNSLTSVSNFFQNQDMGIRPPHNFITESFPIHYYFQLYV